MVRSLVLKHDDVVPPPPRVGVRAPDPPPPAVALSEKCGGCLGSAALSCTHSSAVGAAQEHVFHALAPSLARSSSHTPAIRG